VNNTFVSIKMLGYVISSVFLLVATLFAYYFFLQPKKRKPPSTTPPGSGRSESLPVGVQQKLMRSSSEIDDFIPEYIPVYKAPGNVSNRSPEFKVPAPRFNKSRPNESRRGEKDCSLNVTRPSLGSSSSSSDTEDHSDEDTATFGIFEVERRPKVKPTSLSVTQTPSHFLPALENSRELKKRKRRSSADREKKRKRRLACESISSFKGATIAVKRRKGNNDIEEKLQKKRSLSVENATSRRLKVKKIDASALYDRSLDVGCGTMLNSSLVGAHNASSRLVDVRPVKSRTKSN